MHVLREKTIGLKSSIRGCALLCSPSRLPTLRRRASLILSERSGVPPDRWGARRKNCRSGTTVPPDKTASQPSAAYPRARPRLRPGDRPGLGLVCGSRRLAGAYPAAELKARDWRNGHGAAQFNGLCRRGATRPNSPAARLAPDFGRRHEAEAPPAVQ